MPNTPPRSYNDLKRLAGEVPAPVPAESAYRVTAPIDEGRRRDLEIKALRRSLNIERSARYRLEQRVERLNWLVAGSATACVFLSIAGILALTAGH